MTLTKQQTGDTMNIDHAGYYMPIKHTEQTYQHIDTLTTGSIWRLLDETPSYVVYLSSFDDPDEIGAIYVDHITIGEGVMCVLKPSKALSVTQYTFSAPVNITVRGKSLIVSETMED